VPPWRQHCSAARSIFDTGGRDIASLEMEKLVGPGVVVDISDIAEDWSIYTPQDLMDRADIRKGDIIFIYTGYHKYSLDGATPDERRYMLRHPGPSVDFPDWMKEMELKYIAVDAGSADHPMNTKIRDWEPGEAEKCDAYMREKYGKGLMRSTSGPTRIRRCTSGSSRSRGKSSTSSASAAKSTSCRRTSA